MLPRTLEYWGPLDGGYNLPPNTTFLGASLASELAAFGGFGINLNAPPYNATPGQDISIALAPASQSVLAMAAAATPSYGAIWYLASGTYLISQYWVQPNYVRFQGAGASTVLQMAPGANLDWLFQNGPHDAINPFDYVNGYQPTTKTFTVPVPNGPTVNVYDPSIANNWYSIGQQICNLTIDCNAANNPSGGGSGIAWNGVKDGVVSHVKVINAPSDTGGSRAGYMMVGVNLVNFKFDHFDGQNVGQGPTFFRCCYGVYGSDSDLDTVYDTGFGVVSSSAAAIGCPMKVSFVNCGGRKSSVSQIFDLAGSLFTQVIGGYSEGSPFGYCLHENQGVFPYGCYVQGISRNNTVAGTYVEGHSCRGDVISDSDGNAGFQLQGNVYHDTSSVPTSVDGQVGLGVDFNVTVRGKSVYGVLVETPQISGTLNTTVKGFRIRGSARDDSGTGTMLYSASFIDSSGLGSIANADVDLTSPIAPVGLANVTGINNLRVSQGKTAFGPFAITAPASGTPWVNNTGQTVFVYITSAATILSTVAVSDPNGDDFTGVPYTINPANVPLAFVLLSPGQQVKPVYSGGSITMLGFAVSP